MTDTMTPADGQADEDERQADEDERQADEDERTIERIEAQMLERYQQSLADYLEADRKADLQDRIVHLDRKIEQVKHEIACWQGDLNELEIERAASVDELDELEELEDGNDSR
jgi:chromosome segregation ATPase